MKKLLRTMMVMAVGSILILAISAVPARAQLSTFTAVINSGQEVPANNSRARGVAFVTFNAGTGEVCFSISYTVDSLTSQETAAHFHFPAPPGMNAGVRITLPPGSPKNGCETPALTEQDITELFTGLWYINIHTTVNPGGEIRGQVNPTGLSY